MDDEGYLTMSTTELHRLEILGRVRERRLTQAHAAAQLGLSVRQVERLCRTLRLEGPRGLVSKRRGRTSNRRLPANCVRTRWHWSGLATTTLVRHSLPRSSVSATTSSCRSRPFGDG